MPKPRIVLVHGAWADGWSWNAVATGLQGDGVRALVLQSATEIGR
jgi:hypothetical protein